MKKMLIVVLLLFSPAFAKSYYYNLINLDIFVLKNGDINVIEKESFHFNGNFSYAYRSFYKNVEDFKVQGYATEKTGNKYVWHGSWKDTDKTFVLTYKIKDPFVVKKDYDLLYYTIVFKDRSVPVKSAVAHIYFPKSIKNAKYEINEGSVKIINDSVIMLTASDIPPNTAVDFRIKLPKGVINPPNTWKNFLSVNNEFLSFLFSLPLILFSLLIVKGAKEYKKAKENEKNYEKARPEDYPPAMAGLLLEFPPKPKEIMATVIDLAIRGYIYIHKIVKAFRRDEIVLVKTKNDFSKLNDYEKEIMEVLFSKKDSIKIKDLHKKFKPITLKIISRLIKKEGQKLNLYEKDINILLKDTLLKILKWPFVGYLLVLGYGTYFYLMNLSLFYTNVFIATMLINYVSLLVMTIKSFSVISLTPKGYGAKKAFNELKEYIEKSPLKEGRVFDTYLPYAISLGVQKKWIKKAKQIGYKPYWADSNINLKSLSTFITTSSSGVGGGGGGGGGGAGGGGGGAG